MNDELQVENGNYTRIVNKVLEELVKTPLLGAELAICFFVIRKTYGFCKVQDEISLTQFEDGVCRSRPTVVKALKNLQLVNILKLVKRGDSKISSNIWSFNKYYETWKLVKTRQLVKSSDTTSKVNAKQLVKTPLHTKETITKENTKERGIVAVAPTPAQITTNFFNQTNLQEEVIQGLINGGIPEDIVRREVSSFISYWLELNTTGKKQRWQLQPTFEVKRRLITWFSKNREFNNKEKKGIKIC